MDDKGSGATHDNLIQSLYLTYSTQIYKYILTQGIPKDKAEDILQDVFLIALLKEDSLKQSENKCGWLYKTAQNYVKKDWTRIFKEKQLLEFLTEKFQESIPQDEVSEIFETLKENLSKKEYQYIYEKFILDKSSSQIAVERNKSVTAITSFGNRIYNKIRKKNLIPHHLKGGKTK